jgi:hypothetical protein
MNVSRSTVIAAALALQNLSYPITCFFGDFGDEGVAAT